MTIAIHCAYDKLVPLTELLPNPKNPNSHDEPQIARLAKIIEYNGVRRPITVSKRSGFISVGHGRLQAAKRLEMTEYPVSFQDYDTEESEYADMVADNAIGGWSRLDLSNINAGLGDLGPDFDIDCLGIKSFELEPADKYTEDFDEEWKGMPEFTRDDTRSYRHIAVHFNDEASVQKFAEIIGQQLTNKTRTIWYPHQAKRDLKSKIYQ